MNKIYGNEQLLSTLGSMVQSGRAAHSMIFFGERGSGRRTMADYYTQLLMCEAPEGGVPCGRCAACKTVSRRTNPDVLYVPTEGKLDTYTVGIARSVIRDAYVKPNNHTGKKVYIFRNCRNMSDPTQNMLLKIIEEPPDYAYFIFTAESRSEFLATIISRCVCFGTSTCTEADAEDALTADGYSSEDIRAAIDCFHGNIGMCKNYLYDSNLRGQVDLTKRIADSIIRRDEYGLNAAFYSVGSGRSEIKDVLSMIDKLIRDAAVLAHDPGARTIGVYRDGAQRLSSVLTSYRAVMVHEQIERSRRAVDANVSPSLVLAALCGDIMEIIC